MDSAAGNWDDFRQVGHQSAVRVDEVIASESDPI